MGGANIADMHCTTILLMEAAALLLIVLGVYHASAVPEQVAVAATGKKGMQIPYTRAYALCV